MVRNRKLLNDMRRRQEIGMKRNQIKEGNQIVTAILYVLAILSVFIAFYPMYFVLIQSLSEAKYVLAGNLYALPKGVNLDAYKILVSDTKMWRAYANTILYVVPTTILMIVTSTLVAYGLNYRKLIGRKFLTVYLLVPMYFGGGLIPNFLLMLKLGLYDNPL